MELTKREKAASVSYSGTAQIVMPAEAHLRFQNTDDEGNFLNEQVPVGKQWSVSISVNITETDAA